jgi:hypothetical protein
MCGGDEMMIVLVLPPTLIDGPDAANTTFVPLAVDALVVFPLSV